MPKRETVVYGYATNEYSEEVLCPTAYFISNYISDILDRSKRKD